MTVQELMDPDEQHSLSPDSAEKRTRRKDERPAEIVQAALEVFSEVGFANARISDIAKRANAAKGTVYLYFETKDDLFRGVVRANLASVFSQLKEMSASFPGTCGELLCEVIRRGYRDLASNPTRRAILRILIAEGERFPQLTELYHREILSGAQLMIKKLIQRGIDEGEFRDTPAKNFPHLIVGPVVLSSVWKMIFDKYDPLDLEKLADAHVEFLMSALEKR